MYKQNFRNQAVKEVKNGSTVFSAARKFDIAPSTLNKWIDTYDEKMNNMVEDEEMVAPLTEKSADIQIKSIEVVIKGTPVTFERRDLLKLLSLFNEFI